METSATLALKGGTGKTVTAQNLAFNLAHFFGKRVLLVDCDPQGNTAYIFGMDDSLRGAADVLSNPGMDINEAIYKTQYEGLHIIPGNEELYNAERVAYAEGRVFTLRESLQSVAAEYDYCIIDAAPALNLAVVNALIAADNIIVPLRIDGFSKKGMKPLREQIENAKEANPNMYVKGCLVTHWQNNDVNIQGEQDIKSAINMPFFESRIRFTPKLAESTFYIKPLAEINKRSGATIDYKRFTREYLNLSDSDK